MLDLFIENEDGLTEFKGINYTKKGNKLLFNTDEDKYEFIMGDTIKMIKENKESKISMLFDKNNKSSGLYEIKELNTTFNLNIITKSLEITEKLVIIDYVLYIEEEKAGNFNLKINFN